MICIQSHLSGGVGAGERGGAIIVLVLVVNYSRVTGTTLVQEFSCCTFKRLSVLAVSEGSVTIC